MRRAVRFQLRQGTSGRLEAVYRKEWRKLKAGNIARVKVLLTVGSVQMFKLLKKIQELPNAADFGFPLTDAILAPWITPDPNAKGKTALILVGPKGVSAQWASGPQDPPATERVLVPIEPGIQILLAHSQDSRGISMLLLDLVLESWKRKQKYKPGAP